MFRFVDPEDFESAISRFDREFEDDQRAACRNLFLDLLWPRAISKRASGIVEQSCDTIAASATLVDLFPEAKFIHVVRDGRDASASRVAQTRRLIYPRTRRQGIEWWESRIRRIDEGVKGDSGGAVPRNRARGSAHAAAPAGRQGGGVVRRRQTRQEDEALLLGHDGYGCGQHRPLA